MAILWQHGSSSAVEIHQRLQATGPVAYSTVVTELGRLCGKSFAQRIGRYQTARYAAIVSRDDQVERAVLAAVEGLVKTYGRAAIHGFADTLSSDNGVAVEIRALLEERSDKDD